LFIQQSVALKVSNFGEKSIESKREIQLQFEQKRQNPEKPSGI